MSMCRVFSCAVRSRCLLWPVCSPGKTLSLCPASFCTPRMNLPVTPGISWLPTFALWSPIMKRTSLVFLFVGWFVFMVLALESVIGLHRAIQLQLLWHQWLGYRFGLLWYWMVCLGNKGRSLCCFWDCTQVLHFGVFCWLWGLIHFFSGILATVVHVMIIWIKSTHSHPF